jgi:mannose-6-phosphate isomerase-like protein (cupin superfamily)
VDRDKEGLKIAGLIPLQIKVSTADTGGALFLMEHTDMGKGGPPRHVHFKQDEWFYAVNGEFAFVVGDETFRLRPGDSLFAPQKVPHVWACGSDTAETLTITVSPAGTFETFIRDAAKLTKPPTTEEDARAFAAHGMKLLGPPLRVD